ncbi:MAG: hypothetical protein M1815_002548 [Lichina confinis]|nr:MAG: hypothetical protein M1815_002548 [Lichina confinis]
MISSATDQVRTTTTNSIADRLREIPAHEIPQAFQDAMSVTRLLGLEYIWIDSLCIIQDSPDDWAREASKMHRIYTDAYLTIAATLAESAHDGFLRRAPPVYPPVRMPYAPAGQQASPGFFYFLQRQSSSDFGDLVEATVWNSRGWTLQERVLSPRVLHFARGLLFFECRSSVRVEDNRPVFWNLKALPLLSMSPWFLSHAQVGADTYLAKHYAMWYNVVGRYCKRNLTQSADKLPALSEIAQVTSRLLGDEHLAGFWKGDLHQGLLWNTIPTRLGNSIQEAATYRAPSWSWAQFDSYIVFDTFVTSNNVLRPDAFACFSLVDAVVEPTTSNHMGAVCRAWLKLKGKVMHACHIAKEQYSIGNHFYGYEILQQDIFLGTGTLDLRNCSKIDVPGLLLFAVMGQKFRYEDSDDDDTGEIENAGRIGDDDDDDDDNKSAGVDNTKKKKYYKRLDCLVLEPTSSGNIGDIKDNPAKYRRIGTVRVEHPHSASFDDDTATSASSAAATTNLMWHEREIILV